MLEALPELLISAQLQAIAEDREGSPCDRRGYGRYWAVSVAVMEMDDTFGLSPLGTQPSSC